MGADKVAEEANAAVAVAKVVAVRAVDARMAPQISDRSFRASIKQVEFDVYQGQ